MKRYLIALTLVFLLFAITACSPEETSEENEKITQAPNLEITNIYKMNEYLGFPEGNTLKMHSTCYDEDIEQGYAAGIMTSEIAVFQEEQVLSYVDTEMGKGDFKIKSLFCDDGVVIVSTSDRLVKIDGETLEVTDDVSLSKNIFYSGLYMNPEENLLMLPVPENATYEIYNLEKMKKTKTVDLERAKISMNEEGQIIALETASEAITEYGGFKVSFLNSTTFEEEGSLVISSRNTAVHAEYDSQENDFWILLETGELMLVDLDDLEARPVLIDTHLEETKGLEMDDEYVVVLTENGFDYEGYGDFLGGISVIDRESQSFLYTLQIPSHHTELELDKINHKVYLTNNGDNSVTKVDLKSGVIEAVIQAGSSAEGLAVAGDGSLYVRSRLGGSHIMHLDPSTSEFKNIESPYAWPMWISYSPNLDKIFTYDFLASAISELNTQTDKFTETHKSSAADGSTDGVGHATYDFTHDYMYFSVPENNLVVVMDTRTGEEVKILQIEDYLTDKAYEDLSGPGNLVLATYEETAKLFVYTKKSGEVYVYDGLQNFKLAGEIKVQDAVEDMSEFPYSLFVDQENKRLHVGSQIYDIDTFENVGEIAHGNVAVAIDYENEILFTAGVDGREEQETLYALSWEGELLDEIDLSKNQYVNSRFTYDSERGVMYVSYMVPSEVWAVDVF